MKFERGKFYFEVHDTTPMARAIVLVGFGDYRARLDVARRDNADGWRVKRTKLRVWQNLKYGIFSPTREIFAKSWTH